MLRVSSGARPSRGGGGDFSCQKGSVKSANGTSVTQVTYAETSAFKKYLFVCFSYYTSKNLSSPPHTHN